VIRRPGIVVATVFALGALLGLGTSSVFLSVDASEIRASAERRASAQSGPIATRFLDALGEQDVFGRIADDVRADQIRNLLVAAAVAAVVAVALGVVFSRRALREPVDHD
jgi:hypothetical protein